MVLNTLRILQDCLRRSSDDMRVSTNFAETRIAESAMQPGMPKLDL